MSVIKKIKFIDLLLYDLDNIESMPLNKIEEILILIDKLENKYKNRVSSIPFTEGLDYYHLYLFLISIKENIAKFYQINKSIIKIGDIICCSLNDEITYGLVTDLRIFETEKIKDFDNNTFFYGHPFLKSGKLSKKIEIIAYSGIFNPNIKNLQLIKIIKGAKTNINFNKVKLTEEEIESFNTTQNIIIHNL